MLFSQYIDEVKRRIVRDISSTDLDAFIKRWVNLSCTGLETKARWKCLRREETLTTADGEEDLILPIDFGRMGFFWHREFGYNYKMEPIPERLFAQIGFTGDTEGYPYWYRMFECPNVEAQPSSASAITVVSDEASDARTVRIEGVVGGYPRAESVTINGITAVAGTLSFTKIFRISISSATTNLGQVTITSNAAVVTVGVIPAGQITQTLRRKWIKLYYIPDDAYSIYAYYYRKLFSMVNDNDASPFDEDYDEAIILGAQYVGLRDEEGRQKASKQVRDDLIIEVKRLRGLNSMQDDWLPLLRSMDSRRNRSSRRVINMGAYYPSVRH